MSWEFSTDAALEEDLNWIRDIVQRELWPREAELRDDCHGEVLD